VNEDERSAALRGLLHGEIPVHEARQRLSQFPWDSDVELQSLTRQDLIRMLDHYLAGSVTGGDVEQWADAIEGRDDVGFEAETHELLRQAIFELANPDITHRLEPERARKLQERLRGD
jgi:hypothetical protein